ncbi:MAG: DegT/DnrJ/EryC1/StrS family aminotransferase [Acidimicrobiales bacterium]|nr:DegT/DnrJ/EryC1/StrS family aminotransferase [Acidimicrobiales bacterium]
MTKPIPFLSPTFPAPAVIAADYAAIVERGIYSNSGPLEMQLAREVSDLIGHDVSVALVTSGTTALQLAIASTFRPGRRFALVPSFTFPAGPLALRWCGFEPIFLDIEFSSWQPGISSVQQYIQRHGDEIGGILLTNTFGVA